MAAPNIVNVATITGRTTGVSLTSTAATVVVANTTASGMVLKINSLMAANLTTAAAAFSLAYNTSSGGAGTSFILAKAISVPGNASLIAIDKNSQLYLEENKSLLATAGSSGVLEVTVSYEEIS